MRLLLLSWEGGQMRLRTGSFGTLGLGLCGEVSRWLKTNLEKQEVKLLGICIRITWGRGRLKHRLLP